MQTHQKLKKPNSMYYKRFSVSALKVLKWFKKYNEPVPKEFPKEGTIELIEVSTDDSNIIILSPFFIAEMSDNRIVGIKPYPQSISELTPPL
ncbi:hypothetical protein QTN25_001974 [Entamoeba marina]